MSGALGLIVLAACAVEPVAAVRAAAVSEFVAGVGEIIWQRPDGPVHGLALSVHGCCGTANNSFLPSPTCPRCYFMPVENRQREMCLTRGLAFLALSSSDRSLCGCWTRGKRVLSGEMERIRIAVELVLARLEAAVGKHLPWYALGTSSGGIVVLQMPRHGIYPSGIISVVMGVPKHMLVAADGRPFPPTAFVHMVKDSGTARAVREDVKHLVSENVPALELPLQPSAITSDFFSKRDPTISAERSAALAAAFQRRGFLNEKLQLRADPRYSPWRSVVLPLGSPLAGNDSLVRYFSPLDEHLTSAYAFHCGTNDRLDEALHFILSQPAAATAQAAAGAVRAGARAPELGHTSLARSLYRGCAPPVPAEVEPAASTREPLLVVIGVQKAATTSLQYALKAVPHWCGTRREPHFFDQVAWAARPVSQAGLREYLALWDGCPLPTSIRYEKTPDLLVSPHAALRVCQTLPAVRLVAVLREPVSRAFSGFHETFFSGGSLLADAGVSSSADGFDLLARVDTAIVDGCGGLPDPSESSWDVHGSEVRAFRACCHAVVMRIRGKSSIVGASALSPSWPGCECLTHEAACTTLGDTRAAPVRRGVYSRQLRTWYTRFRPEQLLLLLYDDLTADPAAGISKIVEFATGTQHGNSQVGWRVPIPHYGARSKKGSGFLRKDMHAHTAQHLARFYAPFNTELEELLGRRLPERWHSALAAAAGATPT